MYFGSRGRLFPSDVERGHSRSLAFDLADFRAQEFLDAKRREAGARRSSARTGALHRSAP